MNSLPHTYRCSTRLPAASLPSMWAAKYLRGAFCIPKYSFTWLTKYPLIAISLSWLTTGAGKFHPALTRWNLLDCATPICGSSSNKCAAITTLTLGFCETLASTTATAKLSFSSADSLSLYLPSFLSKLRSSFLTRFNVSSLVKLPTANSSMNLPCCFSIRISRSPMIFFLPKLANIGAPCT